MTGSDRKLVDLIMELTDFGTVWPLNDVVQHWGRDRAARVVSDGFAVVRHGSYARRAFGIDDDSFLPVEEALVLIHPLKKTDDCLILESPWAAICREDDPDLIDRYAADDPKAVAEVKQRHAQRRDAWEQRQVSS